MFCNIMFNDIFIDVIWNAFIAFLKSIYLLLRISDSFAFLGTVDLLP